MYIANSTNNVFVLQTIQKMPFSGICLDPWFNMPARHRVGCKEPMTGEELSQVVCSFSKLTSSKSWTAIVFASHDQVSLTYYMYLDAFDLKNMPDKMKYV